MTLSKSDKMADFTMDTQGIILSSSPVDQCCSPESSPPRKPRPRTRKKRCDMTLTSEVSNAAERLCRVFPYVQNLGEGYVRCLFCNAAGFDDEWAASKLLPNTKKDNFLQHERSKKHADAVATVRKLRKGGAAAETIPEQVTLTRIPSDSFPSALWDHTYAFPLPSDPQPVIEPPSTSDVISSLQLSVPSGTSSELEAEFSTPMSDTWRSSRRKEKLTRHVLQGNDGAMPSQYSRSQQHRHQHRRSFALSPTGGGGKFDRKPEVQRCKREISAESVAIRSRVLPGTSAMLPNLRPFQIRLTKLPLTAEEVAERLEYPSQHSRNEANNSAKLAKDTCDRFEKPKLLNAKSAETQTSTEGFKASHSTMSRRRILLCPVRKRCVESRFESEPSENGSIDSLQEPCHLHHADSVGSNTRRGQQLDDVEKTDHPRLLSGERVGTNPKLPEPIVPKSNNLEKTRRLEPSKNPLGATVIIRKRSAMPDSGLVECDDEHTAVVRSPPNSVSNVQSSELDRNSPVKKGNFELRKNGNVKEAVPVTKSGNAQIPELVENSEFIKVNVKTEEPGDYIQDLELTAAPDLTSVKTDVDIKQEAIELTVEYDDPTDAADYEFHIPRPSADASVAQEAELNGKLLMSPSKSEDELEDMDKATGDHLTPECIFCICHGTHNAKTHLLSHLLASGEPAGGSQESLWPLVDLMYLINSEFNRGQEASATVLSTLQSLFVNAVTASQLPGKTRLFLEQRFANALQLLTSQRSESNTTAVSSFSSYLPGKEAPATDKRLPQVFSKVPTVRERKAMFMEATVVDKLPPPVARKRPSVWKRKPLVKKTSRRTQSKMSYIAYLRSIVRAKTPALRCGFKRCSEGYGNFFAHLGSHVLRGPGPSRRQSSDGLPCYECLVCTPKLPFVAYTPGKMLEHFTYQHPGTMIQGKLVCCVWADAKDRYVEAFKCCYPDESWEAYGDYLWNGGIFDAFARVLYPEVSHPAPPESEARIRVVPDAEARISVYNYYRDQSAKHKQALECDFGEGAERSGTECGETLKCRKPSSSSPNILLSGHVFAETSGRMSGLSRDADLSVNSDYSPKKTVGLDKNSIPTVSSDYSTPNEPKLSIPKRNYSSFAAPAGSTLSQYLRKRSGGSNAFLAARLKVRQSQKQHSSADLTPAPKRGKDSEPAEKSTAEFHLLRASAIELENAKKGGERRDRKDLVAEGANKNETLEPRLKLAAVCNLCSNGRYQKTNMHHIVWHMPENVKGQAFYNCIRCDFRENNAKLFRQHIVQHESPDIWISYQWRYKANFLATAARMYSSVAVHEQLRKQTDTWFHHIYIAQEEESLNFTFRGAACRRRHCASNKFRSFIEHARAHIGPDRIPLECFVCNLCSFRGSDYRIFARHLFVAHKSVDKNVSSKFAVNESGRNLYTSTGLLTLCGVRQVDKSVLHWNFSKNAVVSEFMKLSYFDNLSHCPPRNAKHATVSMKSGSASSAAAVTRAASKRIDVAEIAADQSKTSEDSWWL